MTPQPTAAAPAAAAPPAPPPPRLIFDVADQSGQTGKVDEQYVAKTLAGAGHAVKGLTPDGARVILADQGGDYEVDVRSLLGELGWQVQAVKPLQADYDNVQSSWRAAVSQLTNDDERHQYLTSQMTQLGMASPVIEGAGDDWYVHNPGSGDWVALTNKSGFDTSDILPGVMGAGHLAGAIAGGAGAGALGLPSGPGALAAAAAGAAGGGALAEAGMRGVHALLDPQFRAVAGQNLGNQAKDIALSAAGDALAPVGGAALGALARRAGGAGLARFVGAPVTRTAAPVGRVTARAGETASDLGRAFSTPMGKTVGAGLMFPEASLGGFLAQVPSGGLRIGANAMRGLGQQMMKLNATKGLGKNLRWGAGHISKAPSTAAMFGRAANLAAAPFRGGPAHAGRLGSYYAEARMAGLPADEARRAMLRRGIAGYAQPGRSTAYDVGSAFGRAAGNLEGLGRAVDKVTSGIAGATASGVNRTGQVMQGVGKAMDRYAPKLEPLERGIYGRGFAEGAVADPLRDIFDDPYLGAGRPRMTTLAGGY